MTPKCEMGLKKTVGTSVSGSGKERQGYNLLG